MNIKTWQELENVPADTQGHTLDHCVAPAMQAEIDELREALKAQPVQPVQPAEPGCSDHPDAPHGFNRNASHNAHRYVCDCEGWTP